MEKRNVTVSAIVAAIVLIGDQLSKHWAETWLRTNGEYKIWDGVLHLRYVENRGAAFGIFENMRWMFLLGTGLILVLAVFLFRRFPKKRKYLPFFISLTKRTFILC